MDYEKAYKDALERARIKRDEYRRLDPKSYVPQDIEYIFPELRESEDEMIRNWLLVQLETNYKGNYWAEKAVAYLEKQKEQEPAWSEEDEFYLGVAISMLKAKKEDGQYAQYILDETETWLKSRHPQPKQEWSEEDEKELTHIIRILDDCYAYGKHDLFKTDHENLVNKLKHLRPQPHWKPSEEQIYSLGAVVKGAGENSIGSIAYNLKELYEELKKL